MRKQIIALVLAITAGVLALSGCSNGENTGAENTLVKVVPLPDGRTVTCVSRLSASGGIDCDWASAK